MLSIGQKESILRKEGAVVPAFPIQRTPYRPRLVTRTDTGDREQHVDLQHEQAVREWRRTVEMLFDAWLAAQR